MRKPVERKSTSSAVMKAFRDLTQMEVLVGLPASAGDVEGGGISIAAVGYLMETGSPVNNIPERPWLKPGVESVRDKITAQMLKAGRAAAKGDAVGVRAGMEGAGLIAQAAVKAMLNSNVPPPLSPRTIAARKNRKVRPNLRQNTLVDRGDMRDAVTYVVVKKERR